MKGIAILLFLCFSFAVNAGDFRLGKVSKEELMEKEHFLDPSANAAFLFKRGNTYFDANDNGWLLITEVEVRIKIYKKAGYDYANVSIPFYHTKNSTENVVFSDAVTYNLVDGKIKRSPLKKKDNFIEEVSSNKSNKKILLTDVREGSVVEYKYIVTSPYVHDFPDWYFQQVIPVNYVEYTVNIPQMYSYNRIMNSYYRVNETSSTKRRVTTGGILTLTFTDVCRHYMSKNLPAFKSEQYIDNPLNYLLFVKHELSSITGLNDKTTDFVTSWESVGELIYESSDFGCELKEIHYFMDDIDSLVNGIVGKREKVNKVFDYVKNRMTWVGLHGISSRYGVEKAYEEKKGNSGDINLMLIAMLNYVGVNANPVILSTRDNGQVDYISINSFNYVIAAAELEDGIILLDATSKHATPGVLPLRDLNGVGRLIREDYSHKEIELNPIDHSKENIYVTAKLEEDGRLTGEVSSKYYDYKSMMCNEKYFNLTQEERIQETEADFKNVEIADFNYNEGIEASVSYNFTANDCVEVIGDNIYISPLLFYTQTENPFREEKRLYPMNFIFPSRVRHTFVITIPEGYKIESLPQPQALVSDMEIMGFNFNVMEQNGKIQIVFIEGSNYSSVGAEYYESLKDFYTKKISKQAEKIILKKK
ncbi:DUF3857 and transglutaminase domain-containing protein [Flavobacterium beibuense]|uniref:Transglutaminase-like superfamily protein n=1 Tax=Flavobacterium beibuense TaxID=657326 RepID=A0A444WC77_9FLAO|nr:DUF3857 and transglutaminase domain-containing protein [Flavobacterium beibuense]RYJ43437.1 Transglutaminase-like superfamily protein [Flavobacterium beibuense]